MSNQPAQRHSTCHATGCHKPVAPSLGFCTQHWKLVPREMKKRWHGEGTSEAVVEKMVEAVREQAS